VGAVDHRLVKGEIGMPFFRFVKPHEAAGAVKEEYAKLEQILGFVPSMTQVLSLKPRTMEAHQNLFRVLFYGPSKLSRADREMISTYVSKLNRCVY
jgi:alkylhydroperoxidase family enzyme